MSGGNDEIKSALDIALEKAQKLGALSAEEKQRLREGELVEAAEALAKRYLGGLPLRDVEAELEVRGEWDRKIVISYMLSSLVETVDIKLDGGSERVLAAIEHFSGDQDAVRSIRELLHEYQGAVEKARQENWGALESAMRKELELKGISGSAVVPAVETSSGWLQIQHRLDSHYQERLDELKAPWKKLSGRA